MTPSLEDAFVSEARRQGFQPSSAALNEFAVRHAGENVVVDHLQRMDHSLISIADIVSDIRQAMPGAFQPITGQSGSKETLTEQMANEVRQSRATGLPSDWEHVRSKVTGKTLEMMNEITSSRTGVAAQ
jgi:hypothetical protein